LKKIIYVICLGFLLTAHLQAQESDSLFYDDEPYLIGESEPLVSNDTLWYPNPKKATMLSAALPGAGQIYNRQWWKVPILYAGMGTLAYFIHWNNEAYVNYKNAYIDFVDDDPATTRYEKILPDGYEITDDSWFESTVENGMDSYRRDRDLLIISLVGVYALNIIEANVAAHLYDFDVSDDLSLNLSPNLDYDFYHRNPRLGVSLTLNINK